MKFFIHLIGDVFNAAAFCGLIYVVCMDVTAQEVLSWLV